MFTLADSQNGCRRAIWTTLLAACISVGMAHRAWADDDHDDHEHHHHHHDVHVHLPGIHVDVNRTPPVVVAPAPPPVVVTPPPPPPPEPPPPADDTTATPSALIENARMPYEILTRGPVHEAFAEPVVFNPTPGITVPKAPPAAIDEVPPDQRPEGDNVVWIPGYWAWDDDRADFIWVSGIWRKVPPGRQFIPGYWNQTDTGYQWVSGFWQSDQIETVQYLPQPPQSTEEATPAQAPQADYTWVPGVWLWRDNTYVWRAGYWMPPQENWVWVPAHYCWAPAGYVFINGYWDYTAARRGVLFAPAYMPPTILSQATFVYTPSVVVNPTILTTSLFARPRYEHYYFGDYYARDYFRSGIYPAYAFNSSRVGYDPLFAHYLARQGGNREQVIQRVRDDYRYRRDNPDYRPPRTFAALQEWTNRRPSDPRVTNFAAMAVPLNAYAQRRDLPLKFQGIQQDHANAYRQGVAEARNYQNERMRLESQRLRGNVIGPTDQGNNQLRTQQNGLRNVPPADRRITPPGNANRAPLNQRQGTMNRVAPGNKMQPNQQQPLNLQLKRSPITGQSTNQSNRDLTPPPNPKETTPNTNIQPHQNAGGNRKEPRK